MSMVRPVFATAFALALYTTAPLMAAGQDVKRGAEVYAAQKCSVCHSIAGKGGKSSPLDGVGSKFTAEQLKEWIVDPITAAKSHSSTKKPPMPKKYDKLPAADIDNLVAYMASLKK